MQCAPSFHLRDVPRPPAGRVSAPTLLWPFVGVGGRTPSRWPSGLREAPAARVERTARGHEHLGHFVDLRGWPPQLKEHGHDGFRCCSADHRLRRTHPDFVDARHRGAGRRGRVVPAGFRGPRGWWSPAPVSYTHLTLPTIYS